MTIQELTGYLGGETYLYDDESIGKEEGVDGEVYEIIGKEAFLLAKIFKKSQCGGEFLTEWKLRQLDRFERIKALQIASKKSGLKGRVAFPKDVLVDRNNVSRGLLLPRAQGMGWGEVAKQPIDLAEIIKTCISLADTVCRLHLRRIYIGDWNPANFLVHEGVTTLIDSDSFRVEGQGKIYPNPFHFVLHDPPEMKDPNWTAWNLGSNQDSWGLAILFYQMLLNIHPFHCVGSGHQNSEEAICAGMNRRQFHFDVDFSANGERSICLLRKQRLFLSELPFDLVSSFFVTFQLGFEDPTKRLTAREWLEALRKLKFSQCREGHNRFNHVARCPICDV
jgi:DNA-binding helix-hairpin-helix protein with protein kinase domain